MTATVTSLNAVLLFKQSATPVLVLRRAISNFNPRTVLSDVGRLPLTILFSSLTRTRARQPTHLWPVW